MENPKLENKMLPVEPKRKDLVLTAEQLSGLETITLSSSGDDPTLVVCFNWKTAKEFNEAFKREGWSEPGNYTDEDLRHIWGKQDPSGAFSFTYDKEVGNALKNGYTKMTVTNWD